VNFRLALKLIPVIAALALAGALFLPLGCGNVYSMNGPFMYHVYPWAAFVGPVVNKPGIFPAFAEEQPRVRGINLHQHDYSQAFYPSIVGNTNALRHWQLPIWRPDTMAGVPGLNGGITEYTHPLRLILYLTLPPLLQTQVWIFLSVAFSFLGMFTLMRSIELHPMAAALAGVVWSMNGVFIFYGLFENVPAVNAMVPWTLFMLRRAIVRQEYSTSILAGGLWGLLFHNGHLQFSQMWSWTYLFFYTGLLLQRLRQHDDRPLCTLRWVWSTACIGGVAAAVGAPVLVRMILWFPDIHRTVPSADMQLAEALPLSGILRMLPGPGFPGWHYDHRLLWDSALMASVGVVPLGLAVLGLVWGALFRRNLAIVAGLSMLLGLGVSLGFRPLIVLMRFTLPFFASLHTETFLYFMHLGIVLLVALGAHAIAGKLATSHSVKSGHRLAGVLLCALLLVQTGQGIAAFYLSNPSHPAQGRWNFPETPIIQKAKELQGYHRIIEIRAELPGNTWLKPMLPGALAGLYGLVGAGGYESLAPTWVVRLWRSVEIGQAFSEPSSSMGPLYTNFFDNRVIPSLLRRLSIGLIMATPEARLRSPDGVDLVGTEQLREVYRGPDGTLYVVPGALPRAFLVPDAKVDDTGDSLTQLINGTFDPTRTIVVDLKKGSSQLADTRDVSSEQSIGIAQIVEDDLTKLTVRIRAHRSGYLQVNDSWAPGWKAMLDGKPVELLRSNYAFRAAFVPAGEHLVEMVYRPWPEIIAIDVEAGAVLIMIIASVASARVRLALICRRARSPLC